jgi:hypothetical protein
VFQQRRPATSEEIAALLASVDAINALSEDVGRFGTRVLCAI